MPFGARTFVIDVDESRMDLRIAHQPDPPPARSWAEVVEAAMAETLDAAPIAEQDLRGKQVAVITDDWGRPTPAHKVVPLILDALDPTGVREEDITFVTASGMHDPMDRDEMARKLGSDVVETFRCISHDAGDGEMLDFVGVSEMGTPVWVNRYVTGADYVIGLGRVYLHVTHGYEGGYKLVLPGVAGFDTILRDHSFNFSQRSVPGIHDNPSRAETDAVGRMVGIDYLINVVVNGDDEPLKAYAGAVERVHHRAIAYGDREVWGAPVGHLVDVTLVTHGSGAVPNAGFDPESVRRACEVTKPGGAVVVLAKRGSGDVQDWRAGRQADDAMLEGLGRDEFGSHLHDLAFSELMRLHERRDWPLSPREIQWRVKAIRGEFYRRRWLMSAERHRIIFTQDPQTALEAALARHGGRPRVLAIPQGRATLPKLYLHQAR
jgi:nickel-dependent lactate racemase